MHWIRQPVGQIMQFLSVYSDGSGNKYANSVQGQIAITRTNPGKYYCARDCFGSPCTVRAYYVTYNALLL